MFLQNVLSLQDIEYIHNLPQVLEAKNKLNISNLNVVNFEINIPDSIQKVLYDKLQLTLSKVPMRLIKGDTMPHTDKSVTNFENTYLIYLNDSPGELVLGETSYSINKNTAFKFSEGTSHKTINTENVPRLLLGPMNELGISVGASPYITYYEDTTSYNILAQSYSYTIGSDLTYGSIDNYTSWKIDYTTNQNIDTNAIYQNGDTLPSNDGNYQLQYYLYPVPNDPIVSNICFPKNTPIVTDQGIINIDKINKKTNTIRGKKIVEITKTITQEKYLVLFEKDALGPNIPSKETIMTQNHAIFYKGEMRKAKEFLYSSDNVKKIKYTGELLYNVLLETHDKMIVNNLICETLNPENPVARLYHCLNSIKPEDRNLVIKKCNNYVESKKHTIVSKK